MRHDLYGFQICSTRYLPLYPPDKKPLDSSNYYVLRLNSHMVDDTQHLGSAGNMQKYWASENQKRVRKENKKLYRGSGIRNASTMLTTYKVQKEASRPRGMEVIWRKKESFKKLKWYLKQVERMITLERLSVKAQ